MTAQITYIHISSSNRVDDRTAAIDIVEEIDFWQGVDLEVVSVSGEPELVYRMETDGPISESDLARLSDAGATYQQL
jgi:hypothetical protein